MNFKIKNRVERELAKFARDIDKRYSLRKISPLLSKEMKDFMLRKGKRLRPVLFVAGYLGFAKKAAPNLYKSAASLELFHDFLIVHDDIIDKSDIRRGRPSMHKRLNAYLVKYKNIKFSGEDLSLIIGDIMFAIAMHAFLSIKEDMGRKERAIKRLLESAIHTGCGEFAELLAGTKDIKDITEQDIYKIYDLKTAYYSFAYPLSVGAILAGAGQDEADRLFRYGVYLGRAFQIKDDILGIFGEEDKIGKSPLTDLQEAKKTLLIQHAYKKSKKQSKIFVKKILAKERVNRSDLLKMRKIIATSGALDYAKKEITALSKKADRLIKPSETHPKYKNFLSAYSQELLQI